MKALCRFIAFAGLAAFVMAAVSEDSVRSIWNGVYTAGQAKDGGVAYRKACAICHGDELEGSNEIPALSGDEFMSEWDGRTLNDLFDKIHATMPPDHHGTLSPEDTADLIGYILASNRLPPGETALSDQAEALKEIRFDAKKPEK